MRFFTFVKKQIVKLQIEIVKLQIEINKIITTN